MNDNQELIDRGFLNVNVTSVRNIAPISEATVTISRGGRTIEVLTTDSAGQTITVELGTPPIEFSQEPTSLKPYAEYTVSVDAPGYVHTVIDGVQLIPQQTAIQNVRMNLTPPQPTQPSPAQITINIQHGALCLGAVYGFHSERIMLFNLLLMAGGNDKGECTRHNFLCPKPGLYRMVQRERV